CRAYAGLEAEEALMTAVDRLGFRLRVRTGERLQGVRLAFPREGRDTQEARTVLVAMGRGAREKIGAWPAAEKRPFAPFDVAQDRLVEGRTVTRDSSRRTGRARPGVARPVGRAVTGRSVTGSSCRAGSHRPDNRQR